MNRPSGNVTFLFTDIEGSTKLAQDFPDSLQSALEKHHSIMHKAFESNNGFVFEIVGDAFCCAFENAGDAVNAAVDAQINLANEKWNEVKIKIRIGIHTGNAEWNGKRYMGYITLARTARVMSVAYGEQIIVSSDAYELCVSKPGFGKQRDGSNFSFRDLGERRLKDLKQPVRLYQVVAEGLVSDFPPLKTLDARPNNLPVQLTSFIGRETEMKRVKDLLNQTHLLTLTGSGGSGKTRLSLQVGADVIDDFASGVWFVELAALFEPALLPQAIMKVFGIKEEPKRSLEDTLCDYLRDKEMLIILDNCEHLVEACSKLVEKLLSSSPKLKIISTSREELRCSGEQTHRVLSLSTPNPNEKLSPGLLSQYEAIRLFTESALAVDDNFSVNNENAAALAQICYHLDGIPLAIELAAARTKVLTVEKIYERLNDRFTLLKGGLRTALPRHQTLRALIDWSYDFLSENEKILWRRLSVFSGGCTLEAAEEICSDEKIKKEEILELLNQLNEKSIILFESGKERYRIMESLKQYGEEKLKEANEAEDILSKHLNYFMELSETSSSKLFGNEAFVWLEKLEAEHSNLQSAIGWSIKYGESEKGARLAVALGHFWNLHGYNSTGRLLLENILDNSQGLSRSVYSKTLNCAGILALNHGDYEEAQEFFEKNLGLMREMCHEVGIAGTLNNLGIIALDRGDYEPSQKFFEESLAIRRELNNKHDIASSLKNLGVLEEERGNYELAQKYFEECLRVSLESGEEVSIYNLLENIGLLASYQGNYKVAQKYFEDSLSLQRKIGNISGIAGCLAGLGNIEFHLGNYEQAEKLHKESLELRYEIGDKRTISDSLLDVGDVTKELGNYEESKKFFEESLLLSREIGDKRSIGYSLSSLGNLAYDLGNYEQAQKLYEESLSLFREIGTNRGIAESFKNLGYVKLFMENYGSAQKYFEESLLLNRQIGNKTGIVESLIGLAGIMSDVNNLPNAVLLLGTVDSYLKSTGVVLQKSEQKLQEQLLSGLQEKIKGKEFWKYYEEGKRLTLEQAAQLAVSS